MNADERLRRNAEIRRALAEIIGEPNQFEPKSPPPYLRPNRCGCAPSPGGPHSAACPAAPPPPAPDDAMSVATVNRGMLVLLGCMGGTAATGLVAGAPLSAMFAGYMISGVIGLLCVLGVSVSGDTVRRLLNEPDADGRRRCGCWTREFSDGATGMHLCRRHCPPGRAATTVVPAMPTFPPPPPPAPKRRPAARTQVDVAHFPDLPLGPCPSCGHEVVARSPYTSAPHPPWHEPLDECTSRCTLSATGITVAYTATLAPEQPCSPACVVVRDPDTHEALGRVHPIKTPAGFGLDSTRRTTVCPHDKGPLRLRIEPVEFDG